MKELFISDIVDRLADAQNRNNGRTPYGWVQKEIRKVNTACPSILITADNIFNELKRRRKELDSTVSETRSKRVHESISPSNDHVPHQSSPTLPQTQNQTSPLTPPPPPQPPLPPESQNQEPEKCGRPVGTTNKKKEN